MLMRHWIVRCNRRVKNPYPLWWRSSRFARRRDEYARRHRQRNKPPPKNFTARFFAINLEYHLPTVSPQQMPSGQHETVDTLMRRFVTQQRKIFTRTERCRLAPFLPRAIERAFHRRRRKQQVLPVYFGAFAYMRTNIAPSHLRARRKEPVRHAHVGCKRISKQSILKSVYVKRHNPHSPCLHTVTIRLTWCHPTDVQSSRATANYCCTPLHIVLRVVGRYVRLSPCFPGSPPDAHSRPPLQ